MQGVVLHHICQYGTVLKKMAITYRLHQYSVIFEAQTTHDRF